ncbi:hypothetical protein [Pseudomonas sp. FEN]|uniref:hypothetical protein n=1 Tax=Pseudomonas sp. FEN TaxID=2767468 RepID=UPI001747F0FB|nr:hypothetical protein [Pseudomonas sp. FEN]
MNRPRATYIYLSPMHVQQGLFAVLVLLVTLLAGQQLQRWNQAGVRVPSLPEPVMQPSHFHAGATGIIDPAPYHLTSVDQAQEPDQPFQPRWVF